MSEQLLTEILRGHRIIRDLIEEENITWDLEPIYYINQAKNLLQLLRWQMQAWEDRYWEFITDPRKISEVKESQVAYIEDVLTWYEMTRLERASVSAELMDFWKSGVGLILVGDHGFGDENWEGKPQLILLYRQWRNLWDHYSSFCATYGDVKLLNPTSITLPQIFESGGTVRIPDFILPNTP